MQHPTTPGGGCPACGKPYNYSAPGGGREHDACWQLFAVKADLAWLRDAYRRSRVIGDEAKKLGVQLAEYERIWPAPLEGLDDLRSKVAALKLSVKGLL